MIVIEIPPGRAALAAVIERLLDHLDVLDGDPDMEPDEDGEDSHDHEEKDYA